jgi:D-3-phosphoglycerate dehydrogenase
MALAMILTAIRKLPYYYKNNFKLSERYKYQIYQFKNYVVGIIGYGRIGKKLFRDLKYLNFNVFFYDINKKKTINYLDLNKLLKVSDIISLNLNYMSKNINFFNKRLFNQCKKNLIFVNTARGEVVNEKDLLNFLKKNKSSSAYLDVIKNETINYKKNILYKYSKLNKNLFITPHIGGATKDALKDTENIVIGQFININN